MPIDVSIVIETAPRVWYLRFSFYSENRKRRYQI